MRGTVRAVLVLAATLAGPLPAFAQDKAPARILVGLAAGGSNDLIARELAERLRTITGDQYIVENKPGAAQRIALAELKRSLPDGRTFIVATNSPFSTLPNVYGEKLGYDPVRDFTPIGRIVKFEIALATGPLVQANNFADFVAWAKANPSVASYGTPGAGTGPHFIGVMLAKALAIPLTHVPYKGGAPALNDLVGGHLPMLINSLPDMLEQHRGGRVRIIATTSGQRSPHTPEVPTLSELGVPVIADIGIDVYGPAGVPADVVARLNAALTEAVNSPATRERFIKYGLIIAPSTPQQLAAFQAEEVKKWAGPIKDSGYTGD
jgi:tripartite-type tricarboxylate transporter receptor subunit TctC